MSSNALEQTPLLIWLNSVAREIVFPRTVNAQIAVGVRRSDADEIWWSLSVRNGRWDRCGFNAFPDESYDGVALLSEDAANEMMRTGKLDPAAVRFAGDRAKARPLLNAIFGRNNALAVRLSGGV
jgi:hypothetical protein